MDKTKSLDSQILAVKTLAAEVCKSHNITFIGFFQNATRTFEQMITEGIDCSTPNASFNNSSLHNVSNNSEFQHIISSLVNSNKIVTSSPKNENKYNLDITTDHSSSTNKSNISIANESTGASSTSNSYTSNQSYKYLSIDPHDKVDVKNYLYNCFEEFQQIPCKLLAKAWIKVIEPKKQSKYPYKLGDSSKPYWWPHGCIHREPDHLKKDERINLLINILKIFKHKQTDLIYTASVIPGLGPETNNTLNDKIDFGKRRMDILKDMFNLVDQQNNSAIKSLKVIKPGKKFSSQIYHKSKSNMSNTSSSSNSNSKIIDTPGRDVYTKFSGVFSTPPSMDTSKLTKDRPLHLPPIVSSNESYYNDLMEYIVTKPDPHAQQTSNYIHIPQIHSNTSSNSLQSPFLSTTEKNKRRNELSTLNTSSQKPLHLSAKPEYEMDLDSKFFVDSNSSSSPYNSKYEFHLKHKTPQVQFKAIDYQVSPPPTGIFTVNHASNYVPNNTLRTLNPSKINKMNQQLYTAINKPKRFDFNPHDDSGKRRKTVKITETKPPIEIHDLDEDVETDYEV